MDPDTFLPRTLRLDLSSHGAASTSKVKAHLMPFTMDYAGPAPVDTYMVLQPAPSTTVGLPGSMPLDEVATWDEDVATEALSSFRGRRLHGMRLPLPPSYRVGFFQVEEESAPGPEDKHRDTSVARLPTDKAKIPTAPPAPVRGARFSLDEDEGEGEEDEGHGIMAWSSQAPAAPRPWDTDAQDSDEGLTPFLGSDRAPPRHCYRAMHDAGSKVWVWAPDGPIDQGGDPFVQTTGVWLQRIAPALHAYRFP